MTQEDKELLLKDLCARLPYGVKIHAEFNGEVYDGELQIVNKSAMLGDYGPVPIVNPVEDDINDGFELTNIKPYLRPLSSMTDEEKKEFLTLADGDDDDFEDIVNYPNVFGLTISIETFDWLNKKMFDHRGLIPMGLALEAKEGMYKNE